MLTIKLKTVYPCCNNKCRINIIVDIPRERFDRTCPKCGTKWVIERTTPIVNNELRADMLEWEKQS